MTPEFDPFSLLLATPHPVVVKYLDKHIRKCLETDEKDGYKKEHPKPSLDLCKDPMVDIYLICWECISQPSQNQSWIEFK